MTTTVTITYFNARLKQQETRDHPVPDLTTVTIQGVVDLFDAQVGTVFSVWAETGCVHRSAVRFSDFVNE